MSTARETAAAEALTVPDSIKVGRYTVRKMSGGDMLVCQRMGLVLSSSEPERVAAMTSADQTAEMLQIGALLCHPVSHIQSALYALPAGFREETIGPVLFDLTPAQTTEVLNWVAGFFRRAQAQDYKIEKKPADETAPSPPTPEGK